MTAAPDPPVCLDCGLPDPPPEQTCGVLGGGRDHRIGIGHESACVYCGRLLEACKQRPCQTRRRASWRRWLRGAR